MPWIAIIDSSWRVLIELIISNKKLRELGWLRLGSISFIETSWLNWSSFLSP